MVCRRLDTIMLTLLLDLRGIKHIEDSTISLLSHWTSKSLTVLLVLHYAHSGHHARASGSLAELFGLGVENLDLHTAKLQSHRQPRR